MLMESNTVGKTYLVYALAMTSQNLVRITLSDQTDIMNIFGFDLDGLNLACLSVLEGLYACHGSVYSSELNKELKVSKDCHIVYCTESCHNNLRMLGIEGC
ncbi:hypothetical protein ROZALSC1DRAFT_25478 [Rozella allomycis CSF55]|uniref:Uncharacterized protein n=1 Tax=Rozella allomycis (strain CSF55) TaxID=988480 RepID=A0A4P9YAK4_ROZAC|nr:hypothetical protein ROZALSC1DRAFT_25478 [Rozella allomycis CSF55]